MAQGVWTLLTVAVTGGISLLTFHLSNKHAVKQREIQSKETFMHNSYEYRIQAYSRLFTELQKFENYFMLFVYQGNEFKESSDEGQFAPLKVIDELREAFHKEGLWITQDTEKAFYELFSYGSIGCNIALQNHMHKEFPTSVENYCIKMLEEIQRVKMVIREDTGVAYVEEYKEKWKGTNALQEVSATKEL